jgi:Tol biopolymer transport system component
VRLGVATLLALVAALSYGRARAAAPPSTVLFSADRAPAQTGEVYRLPFGGKPVDLSRSPFADTAPVVSPDGRWVAFFSTRSGRPAVYAVRAGGGGLHRISPDLPAPNGQGQLAWAPDGRHVAAAWNNGIVGSFVLTGIDLGARVLERDKGVTHPGWSPDGRVATVLDSVGTVTAFRPDGTRAWRAASNPYAGAWSRLGVFATAVGGTVRAYDSAGHGVFSRAGDSATWSPDGSLLATRSATGLAIVDTRGRTVLSRRGVPFGGSDAPLEWATRSAVIVYDRKTGNPEWLDVRTGKLTPHRWQPPADRLAVSADGKRTATAVQAGTSFQIRVTGIGVVGRVPGCFSDGALLPSAVSGHFTSDGRSLVYQSSCAEPFANLWTITPDGSATTRLTNAVAEETQVAASPDGSRLAFTWASRTGLSCKGCAQELWVAASDGSGRHALTHEDDLGYDTSASWSPDGTQLVYEYSTPDSYELRVVPAAGGDPQRLVDRGLAPSWGPTRIAFVGSTSKAETIETVLPDGTGRERLAVGNVGNPAWSRDGRLVWVAQPAGGGQPWLVLWVNGRTTKVAVPFAEIRDVAWSPDGTRLAIAAHLPGTASFDVYTLAPDGTHVARLTRDVDALDVDWRG